MVSEKLQAMISPDATLYLFINIYLEMALQSGSCSSLLRARRGMPTYSLLMVPSTFPHLVKVRIDATVRAVFPTPSALQTNHYSDNRQYDTLSPLANPPVSKTISFISKEDNTLTSFFQQLDFCGAKYG